MAEEKKPKEIISRAFELDYPFAIFQFFYAINFLPYFGRMDTTFLSSLRKIKTALDRALGE